MSATLLATNLFATSNAILTLLLPQVSDFARKLDLPEKTCSMRDVRYLYSSMRSVEGGVVFRNGNFYSFSEGRVQTFRTLRAFYALQDPALIPTFYGHFKLSKTEAAELARHAVRKLGYSIEDLYVDLEPEIKSPEPIGTNTIPHYYLSWPIPNLLFEQPYVVAEVNASEGRLESIALFDPRLNRTPPHLPGIEDEPAPRWRPLPPETAWPLVLAALPKMSDFARKLRWPIPVPITTNQLTQLTFRQHVATGVNEGTVRTTGGYNFAIDSGGVTAIAAPDAFYEERKVVRVRDFAGEWRMSEQDAVVLARNTLVALGVDSKLIAGPPSSVVRPFGQARKTVPRCAVRWSGYSDAGLVTGIVEVDGAARAVKSVQLYQ